MPTLTTSIQHSTASLSQNNYARNGNKRHSNWKKKIKLSLCTDDVILYVENPKDHTHTQTLRINEFSKVTEYKINFQKPVVLLYAKNNQSKM